MPARPVTWDLDIPPPSLLESAKKTRAPREVPSLDKLRTALTGTRFELLKISTFAAFLLAFVGVAIHGSHLANPDNQFAANMELAVKHLGEAASNRIARLRASIEAQTSAMTLTAYIAAGRLTATAKTARLPAGVATTGARSLAGTHATHVARVHHRLNALKTAHSTSVPLEPHHGVFNVTSPGGTMLRDLSSTFEGLIAPDSLIAGLAALFLYVFFVVVLVHAKGGLRAFGGSPAV